MPKTLPRLSPQQKCRPWSFYAIVTFAITLVAVGAIYLALVLKRPSRSHSARLDAASAAGRQFKPATFDGVGWKIEAEDYDLGGEGVGWHDLF